MKTTRFLIVGLAAALCVSGFASDSQAKAQIQANYAKIRQAMLTKNVDAMMALSTPDFKEKHGKLTMNGAQASAQMRQMFTVIKKVRKVDISIKSIKVNGNTALVSTYTMLAADLSPGDNKMHKLVSSGTSKDTWVKTASGWKVKLTEDVDEKTTVDGKVLPTQGGG